MVNRAVRWNIDNLVDTIMLALLSKFDFFIIIEGKRGLGKSTLAYQIAKKLSGRFRNFRRHIGYEGCYIFNPEKDLLYKREQVLNFFIKKRSIGVADEMINVAFGRDFFQTEQKQLGQRKFIYSMCTTICSFR